MTIPRVISTLTHLSAKLIDKFKKVISYITDFLLPRSCIVCQQEIARGAICDNCYDTIIHVRSPICPVCGRPIKKTKTCAYCRHEKYLDYGRAWALYAPPLDTIIHFYKYRRFRNLAQPLGRAMANIVRYDLILNKVDLVVPVPLFWLKQLRRGYNQSSILARFIAQDCGVKMSDILMRTRNTRTQTRLHEDKRHTNVLNAFCLKNNCIEDKTILLVDDVMTTGATIRECARVLKQAGASKVYSIVAGITRP